MRSEGAPDRTSAGWSVGVEKAGGIINPYKIGELRANSVPLSDAEIMGASIAFLRKVSISHSRSGTLTLCVRVTIFAGLVWGALGVESSSKGGSCLV